MKIVIVGAGAMGGLFGGLLKKAGSDVALIDVWKDHVDTINRDGLLIERDGERMNVPIPALFPDQVTGNADLMIVFTKSFNTESAVAAIRGMITGTTWALSLQNGIGHVDIIEQFIPRDRIVHGVTTYPSDLVGPGHIRSEGQGTVKIMSVNGEPAPMVQTIQEALNRAGIHCEANPNVVAAIWEKLAFNSVMNALTSAMGLTVGQVGDAKEGRELAEQIVDEVVGVAHRKEILADKSRIMSMVSMAFEKHRDHRPSMLQDILAKRKTEIDAINGAVVREADGLGMRLPVNETVYRMVKTVENAHSV
jgi:2-dehydropantoate 2-reductase